MPKPPQPQPGTIARRTWARFLVILAVLNLIWEFAQMPLYTLWLSGSRSEIAFAAAHCTVGDILIATFSLAIAQLIIGASGWPARRYTEVAGVTVALALAYTVFSEWWNVEIRQTWAYRPIMPQIPVLGTGLSPLLQWLILPALAFRYARPPRQPRDKAKT